MKNLILLLSFTLCTLVQVFGQVGEPTPPTPPPPPPPPPSMEDEVFKVVEQMPRFPGCEDMTDNNLRSKCAQEKMITFVGNNLVFPKEAEEKGVEGTVVIRFMVSKDGTIKDAKIVRDIGAGCGLAALKVVKKMNDMPEKWIPGKQRGKHVNVYFNLPVKFDIPKNEPSEKATFDKTSEDQESQEEKIKSTNDKSTTEVKPNKEEEVALKKVDVMPRFPGCEDIADIDERKQCANRKMLEFIYLNLRYPAEARKNGVEGTIVIRYIIKKDGSIAEPTIVKEIGAGCGAEGLRVVNLMNSMPEKWIPGQQEGENVDVYFNLPLKFRLEGRSRKVKKKKNRRG